MKYIIGTGRAKQKFYHVYSQEDILREVPVYKDKKETHIEFLCHKTKKKNSVASNSKCVVADLSDESLVAFLHKYKKMCDYWELSSHLFGLLAEKFPDEMI